MSEVQDALPAEDPKAAAADRITAIPCDVSMMVLDEGLYCVVVSPSPAADAASGLPGVRISAAPGSAGRPEAVTVRTIAADGWMSGFGDAALVRVAGGPAQVMISIYHRPGAGVEGAPRLQVLPLLAGAQVPGTSLAPASALPNLPAPAAHAPAAPTPVDMLAHIQTRGDIGARFGTWLGDRGSGKWIEGFAIAPIEGIALSDIEYQAVLGRGWLSPWVEGGQFCGSRGMALPILGLRVRLRGAAASAYELRVSATFIDGTMSGPVTGGESCEGPNLAAVESIMIEISPIVTTQAGADVTEAAPASAEKRTTRAKRAKSSDKAG